MVTNRVLEGLGGNWAIRITLVMYVDIKLAIHESNFGRFLLNYRVVSGPVGTTDHF